ncbi:hypothetical protein L3X38_021628 [Prunus dulcis]|uniref:Uncharacterized protein n=1 Tax=Prunus dulcis TaxID=3755 RepID=A0AAD4VX58_PRUDU|nr:hypothetical protein L3X38_021628 [Prunus dulcis]
MDVISSLECLKLDSQSKVLHKDGVGRDLISPDTVPLNCDTPIIKSKAEERKAAKQCLETPSTYFKLHWTPPPNPIFGIKADAPDDKSSIGIKADAPEDKSSIGIKADAPEDKSSIVVVWSIARFAAAALEAHVVPNVGQAKDVQSSRVVQYVTRKVNT